MMSLFDKIIIKLKCRRDSEIIMSSLEDIFNSFSFINLSQEDFYYIVLEEMEKINSLSPDDILYNDFLVEGVNNKLKEIIRDLLKNPDSAYEVINNYINNNLKKEESVLKSIEQFNIINDFFKIYDFVPSNDLIKKLINNNEIISKGIGLISELFRNTFLSSSIDIFYSETVTDELKEDSPKKILHDINYKNNKTLLQLIKGNYTEEQLDYVLKVLEDEGEDLGILRERYGDSYKDNKFYELSREKHLALYNLVHKIERRLNKIYNYKGQTLYQLMEKDGYSKNKVDEVISTFCSDDIDEFKEIFGDNFDRPFPINEEEKNKNIRRNILKRIRRKLKAVDSVKAEPTVKGKTIYQLLKKYSEEQVDEAILKLKNSGEDISILNKRYGADFKNPTFQILDKEETNKFSCIIGKVRRLIENPNLKLVKNISVRGKTFYELMEEYGYSKSLVVKVVNSLDKEDIEVLKLVYGEKIDEVSSNSLTKEEVALRTTVLRKIRKELSELKKAESTPKYNKTIYQLLDDYTEEQVDETISNLLEKDVLILKNRYGDDFKNPVFNVLSRKEYSTFHKIVEKMKRKLSNGGKRKEVLAYGKSLPELFECSNKQVNDAIELLTEEDKTLLFKRYSKDSFVPVSKLTLEEKRRLFSVLGKIEARVHNPEKFQNREKNTIHKHHTPRAKNIYELLERNSFRKEEIDSVLEKLSEKEKDVIEKRYRDIKSLTIEEKTLFKYTIRKIRKLLKNSDDSTKNINKTIYQSLGNKYSKNQVDSIISNLDEEDINILKEIFGDNFDIPRSDELSKDEKVKRKNILGKIRYKLRVATSTPKVNNNIYHVMAKYGFNEEQVNAVLKCPPLTSDDMRILKTKYGDDLQGTVINSLSKKDKEALYNRIFVKMRKHLAKNAGLTISLRNISIYELLMKNNNYTKEQVDFAIAHLKETDRNLLKLRYGDDLFNPTFNKLDETTRQKVNYVIKKVRVIIENPSSVNKKFRGKTVYQLIEGNFTEKQIDEAISKLSNDLQEIILFRHGGNLKKPTYQRLNNQEYSKYYYAVECINVILGNDSKKNPTHRTIYNFFDKYSMEQVDEAILKLENSGADISIFRKRFGDDFKASKHYPLSTNEYKEFASKIRMVKRILLGDIKKQSNAKTIYQVMENYHYTREQVDSAIEKLSDEDRSVILARHGGSLENPVITSLNKNDYGKYYYILSKIRKNLDNPKSVKKSTVKGKTIYQVMEKHHYTKEQVDSAIEKLSEEDRSVILARHGGSLENPVITALSEKSYKEYYYIVSKIRKIIENPKFAEKSTAKGKNLYQVMKKYGFNEDSVDYVINNLLNSNDISILKKKYGEDLKNPGLNKLNKQEFNRLRTIRRTIKCILSNPDKKIRVRVDYNNKSFYEIIEEYGYTRDMVDKVIPTLDEKDIKLLKLIYGEELNNLFSNKLTNEEKKSNKLILWKIKNRLKNPDSINSSKSNSKTIYQIMEKYHYTREQVDSVIEKLSEEDRNVILARHGGSLENPVLTVLSKKSYKDYYHIVSKIRKIIENPKPVKGKTIYQVMEKHHYTKEQVDSAIEKLSEEDRSVILARHGGSLENPVITVLSKNDSGKYYYIISKIRKIIENPKPVKKSTVKGKTIYQEMEKYNYTKEQVDSAIEKLSEEDRNVILARHGGSLENPVLTVLSKADYKKYKYALIKLKDKIDNSDSDKSNGKTIYQIMEEYGYTKEQVNLEIEKLSDEYRSVILARHGGSLENPIVTVLNESEQIKYYSSLNLIKKRLKYPSDIKNNEIITSKPAVKEELSLNQLLKSHSKERIIEAMGKLSNEYKNVFNKRFSNGILTPEEFELYLKAQGELKNELSKQEIVKINKPKKTVSSSLKSPRNRKTLFNSIVKLRDSFSYINISQEEFDDIVLSSIEDSTKEYNGTVEYNKFLLGIIKDRLNDKVNALVNNTESSYDVINNYIKNTCGNIKTAKKALQEFNRISSFFDLYDYSPDEEVISKLIDDNDVFSKMISLIVRGYRQEILSGNTDSLTYNPSLLSRVCEYVGIDQVDYIEEKTTSNFSNLSLLDRAINEYPVLNADDEYKITKRIAEGDSEARDTFFLSNIRLVKSIAATIHTNFFSFDDLVQEGFLGLMAAIDKFDYTRGYKFSTYASWWIRQSITRAVADKDNTVRLPVHKGDELNRFNRVRSKLIQVLGREPTDVDIAEELGVPLEKVWEMIELPSPTVSLDAPVSTDNDSDTTISNFVPDKNKSPSETFMDKSFSEEFDKFLNLLDLKGRERIIVRSYFGFDGNEPKTLEEVGNDFDVTRERIRQILIKVEKIMVKSRKFDELLEYSEYADVYKKQLATIRENYKKTGKLVLNKPKKKEKVKKNSNRRKKI